MSTCSLFSGRPLLSGHTTVPSSWLVSYDRNAGHLFPREAIRTRTVKCTLYNSFGRSSCDSILEDFRDVEPVDEDFCAEMLKPEPRPPIPTDGSKAVCRVVMVLLGWSSMLLEKPGVRDFEPPRTKTPFIELVTSPD